VGENDENFMIRSERSRFPKGGERGGSRKSILGNNSSTYKDTVAAKQGFF
jgi:hypothetical protein